MINVVGLIRVDDWKLDVDDCRAIFHFDFHRVRDILYLRRFVKKFCDGYKSILQYKVLNCLSKIICIIVACSQFYFCLALLYKETLYS